MDTIPILVNQNILILKKRNIKIKKNKKILTFIITFNVNLIFQVQNLNLIKDVYQKMIQINIRKYMAFMKIVTNNISKTCVKNQLLMITYNLKLIKNFNIQMEQQVSIRHEIMNSVIQKFHKNYAYVRFHLFGVTWNKKKNRIQNVKW